MASDVTMPRLSDSMEEGTVLKWLVEEGGEVTRGEPLVEIETDKANMTYDADTDGVLIEIVAQEGDTLEIGEVIARIGDAGEAKSDGGGKAEEGGEEEAEAEAGEEEGAEEGGEEAEEAGAEEEKEAVTAEAEGEEEAEGEAAEGEEEAGADEEAGPDEEAEGEEAEDEEAGGEEAEGEEAAASAEEGGEDKAEGDEEAAVEGEEAAVAGADGGGGETQAGAGTATREKTSTGNGDGRVKASPVARRMARDLGVELAQLEGTGPGGRIVKADVQAAAENGGGATKEAPEKGEAEFAEEPAEAKGKKKKDKKKDDKKADKKAEKKPEEEPAEKEPQRAEAGAKGEVQIEELTRLQQTVSRRMAESKATAPDFSIALTVDMTAAVELRTRLKQISDPVPSFNDMVVKAAANALREHPRVNGAYRDGKFELYERVNVGIAVAAMDALVVPTIFDADTKSLGQIARDARAVIGKVKDKTVTPPELSGGTFTVSNLGMFGIEHFTAIINPPQAAILTVGKLAKQPAVDDKGKLVARDQITLTLVCDHRILYGADGAEFLARVKDLLEQPLSLSL
jgi:pyruvate dehydrogenase E2 component (dihydrolipoyllysine-residue acetyltransferase)